MGLALARQLAEQSMEVIIAGRDEERLEKAAKAIGCPGNLTTVRLDATREEDVASLFRRIGWLDHIVTTAADIRGSYELLPSLEIEAARRAVESKLFAPLLLAKHGAQTLRPGGSMTFTSGVAAYRPAARGTVVAAVNAALEGLVRALAIELAPIRVNAVSPGWVDTPIWQFVAGEKKGEILGAMAEKLPVGRIGRPEDIAEAIRFLMSNGFTTGAVLHVEGGHRLI
jgi:NAD(P)-dependent dehydrogenase (short-subunit alcohol dehydrogenase family)